MAARDENGNEASQRRTATNVEAWMLAQVIPWGSLLYLYYKGAQNPILIIKGP